MTTDIKELMQELKTAAERATPGEWVRSSVLFNGITNIGNPMEQGSKPHIANTSEKRDAEFIALANPTTINALIEALEAKEARIAELETYIEIHESTALAAIERAEMADRRAVELQSRAETAEQALKKRSAPVGDLVMLIKVLVRGLKKTGLNSELCESAMDYLRREHLISAADCLRNNDGIQIQGGEK